MQAAAIAIRPSPSADSATRYPSPSAPSRFAAGTSAPSNTSSAAGAAPDPHLLLVGPEPEAGRPLLDEECRDPGRPERRVQGGEDEVSLGLRRVRDPDLRAGQAIGPRRLGRPDALRAHPDRRGVGARLRFRKRERTESLSRLHRRQPAGLLLVAPPAHDRVLVEDVHAQGDGERHVGGRDLLDDDGPRRSRQPGAPDRLRERPGQQPELGHPPDECAVEALRLVALDRPRRDDLPGEGADRLAQQPRLGVEAGEGVEEHRGALRPADR